MTESIQKNTGEMNIRETIETIWRGKIIIAVITIIGILGSIIASLFFSPVIYSAKTVIQVTPFNLTSISNQNQDSKIVELLTQLPSMTIDSFMQQISVTEVLESTIESLDLRDERGQLISTSVLASSISAHNIPNTNLIEISVNGKNPQLCAQIANTLALNYIDYISSNTRKLSQQTVDLIAMQLKTEEMNLDEKSRALVDYLKNNISIDVLKAEIKSLIELIVKYEEDINDTEKLINTDIASLEVIQEAVARTTGINPSDFTILIGIDEYISDRSDEEKTDSINIKLESDNLSVALLKIEFSKIQNRLINNLNLKRALNDQLIELNGIIGDKQIKLAEEEYKYNRLNRDLEMAQQAYDAYLQKHKEAMLAAASDIGRNRVIVTSAANPPLSPISTNMMMKIVIVAFISFALGLFVVLFRDYWLKSKRV